MNNFSLILQNKVLLAALLAFFLSQGFKVVLTIIKNRKFDFERIMGSGGMPSSHSATIMAASMTIGRVSGFNSTVFGLAIVVAFVVMYDAAGIRRAAGKQAKILNSIVLALSLHEEIDYPQKLKELLGHTHFEVIVGAILGIIIGLLVTV